MPPSDTLTVGAADPVTRRKSKIAAAVGQIEIFAGSVVAALLALAVCGACVFLRISPFLQDPRPKFSTVQLWTVPLALAVLLCVELISANFVVKCLQSHQPPALLNMVDRQFVFPVFLRPVVAIWWFLHFVAITLAGHRFVPHFRIVEDPMAYQVYATRAVQILFFLGISFSSNTFLVLTTGTLWPRSKILWLVYRSRVVIDLLISAGMFFIPATRWF